MPDLDAVYAHIDARLDEHTGRIQEWIRQPSISNTGEGIAECAELTASYLRELGCEGVGIFDPGVTRWGSRGNPVVYGDYDAGAEKTLIVYMMYDVMPTPQAETWTSPPFDAEIVEMEPFGRVIIGRGAVNSKGPQMALLNALGSIKEVTGGLPVNIKFVAEGDEERMSIGLHEFVHQHLDWLASADAMYGFQWQMEDGTAWPEFGSEGCVYFELETSGASWGRGPGRSDIHGLFKRQVDSPAWRHIKMLSTLVSEDGNTSLVEGWYDHIEEPTAADMNLLEEARPYASPESIKRALHIGRLMDAVEGDNFLYESLYSTTLNLDGIWGGQTEPGTAGAVVPHKVVSKHDARYVPAQDGEDLIRKLRAHLDRHGYGDVKIRVIGDVPWCRVDFDNDIARALFRMYDQFGVKCAKLPAVGIIGLGPYWPAYLFGRDPLQLPLALGGIGHGGGFHAVDEYFVLDGNDRAYGLAGAEKGYATVIYYYAGLP